MMRLLRIVTLLLIMLLLNQILFAQSYRCDEPEDVVGFIGLGWSWDLNAIPNLLLKPVSV